MGKQLGNKFCPHSLENLSHEILPYQTCSMFSNWLMMEFYSVFEEAHLHCFFSKDSMVYKKQIIVSQHFNNKDEQIV